MYSIPILAKVSVMIKTFLRDEFMFDAVRAIQENAPELHLIVIDDGYPTPEKINFYHKIVANGRDAAYFVPFDSGFGFKSNEAIKRLRRPYMLVASDDFDFRPKFVYEGIEKLVWVMEGNDSIDIASGRVNNNKYEFTLKDEGHRITEVPLTNAVARQSNGIDFYDCDLTVNYSLIRRRVFDKVGWDNDVKIGGGEHGAFFVDCKRAGFRTVWVPGVNIMEQRDKRPGYEYIAMRRRASAPQRPCFDKRGITYYELGDGQLDYCRKV